MSRIRIFKTYAEQELHQIQKMRSLTPIERFKKLLYLQNLSCKFHPSDAKPKKIVIHHGLDIKIRAGGDKDFLDIEKLKQINQQK
jgi:hypothetical protein